MKTNNQSYNLRKLKSFVGEDIAVIREMVEIFIQTNKDLLSQIVEGQKVNDLDKIYKAAHAMKPTLDIFGLDDLYIPIREIESIGKTKNNIENLTALVEQFENRLQPILKQLSIDFG